MDITGTVLPAYNVLQNGFQFFHPVLPTYIVTVSNQSPIDVHVVNNDSWFKTLYTTWLSPITGALLAGGVGLLSFCIQSKIQDKRQRAKDLKDFNRNLSLLYTELTQFSQAIIQPEDFEFWGIIEFNTWSTLRPLLSPFAEADIRDNSYGTQAQLVQIVDTIYLFANKVNTLITFYRQNHTQQHVEDKLKALLSWSEVFRWQEEVARAHQLIRNLLYSH